MIDLDYMFEREEMATISVFMDRENAIFNSMASGENECLTLKGVRENENFIRENCIRPTLQICASEQRDLVMQRDQLLAQVESMRFALETIKSNLGANVTINDPSGVIIPALRAALPGLF